jgi:thiol-disulfide isomerase/thioredoxin
LAGCQSNKEKVIIDDLPTKTIISGQFANLEVYPNTKEIFAEVVDYRDRKTVFKDSINADGTFKIELSLYNAQDIKLSLVLEKLILYPGDSIFINFDFNDLSYANFAGDRSKENKDLHDYYWNYPVSGFNSKEEMDIPDFKKYCDSIKTVAFNQLNEFIKKTKPSLEIQEWIRNQINIKYFTAILSYPNRKGLFGDKSYYEWIEMTGFLENVEHVIDLTQSVFNSDAYSMISYYHSVFLNIYVIKENRSYVHEELDSIIFKHTDETFKQFVLGQSFYRFLCGNSVSVVDSYKHIFDNYIKIPFIKEPLNDYYQNSKQDIENPQMASDAILSKMGVNGKNLLDSIIHENKGKVLFVDLWATWCGPCLNGMKTSKEIMPRYKNKDIEFIFLCVNSTEENWKGVLSKYKVGGKHYYCDNEQSKDIRRALGVEGIPHYMIINKNGHIVQTNCPDLKNSQEIIDKLLNEK